MKILSLLLFLNLAFVSCDFSQNKTTKETWDDITGDSSDADYIEFVEGDESGSDSGSDSGNDSENGSDNSSGEDSEEESDDVSCNNDRRSPGLKATLFAIRKQYVTRVNESSIVSLLQYKKLIHIERFIVDNIHTAPRASNLGVVDRVGKYIDDPRSGGELLEDYIIKYDGQLSVDDEQDEGEYEFAMMSDDGVLLKIGRKTIVRNTKLHSPTISCGIETINLQKGEAHDFKLYYHQGPRDSVANALYWRRVDSNNESTPCDLKTKHESKLLRIGWEPVPAHVFSMKLKTHKRRHHRGF